MIKIESVTKTYGTLLDSRKALDDISFKIEEGEFLAIVGTSGSGKTTLLNLIGGLDTHYDGSLTVFSKNLKKLSDHDLSHYRNEYIGFIFQNFNLLNHLSAGENVQLPQRFSNKKINSEKRIAEIFNIVNISDKIDAYPSELSGGQRQRVAIGRALYNHPKILLCDEPTGNLDRNTGLEVMNFFKKLNQEQNITVIIITHEKHIAEMTNRTIQIEEGKIARDERHP